MRVTPDRDKTDAPAPRLVLDWDGTVTVVDTLWLVLEQFGDYDVFTRAGEQLMGGEIDYRQLMEIEFSTVKDATLDEVTSWLVEHAEIRPGFHELIAGHEPLVLSSGFAELIRPLMTREGVDLELVSNRIEARPEGWHVIWNREAPCEVCGDWCKRVGLPAEPFVYVGDGYSDRCPALSAERIFARAGLADYLAAEGVEFEPFETLFDVLHALDG
ncbi:MAG TPA: HAD-IB family phosphatase [Gaiellaceae bacterium]|jgi:HAD superfamily phosphoserine phosphatase-like hydrolase|nr:HAD-IB family phosphatase [Gaiellaceae bacterium]